MTAANRRRAFAAASALALAVIGVLGMAAPAQAHNYLVSSTPAADSTLTELPDAFEIVTNDDLLAVADGAGGFALQVRDADGAYYGDGCVQVDGPSMTAEPALGPAGVYTVLWQVVSADGHTVSDEYTFTWAPTGNAQAAEGSASPPVCGQAAPAASVAPTPADGATDDEPVPEQTADPSPDAAPATAQDDTVGTVLWLGGAVVAIAVAVVATLLVVGRRSKR